MYKTAPQNAIIPIRVANEYKKVLNAEQNSPSAISKPPIFQMMPCSPSFSGLVLWVSTQIAINPTTMKNSIKKVSRLMAFLCFKQTFSVIDLF